MGTPMHGDPYHTGISFDYRPDAAVPQYMVLRILKMKEILLAFQELPLRLKSFILKHVKKCDMCGYCTQTDKTGKRLPLSVEIGETGASYQALPPVSWLQFLLYIPG